MTGPEHYLKAEEALSVLDTERDPEGWEQAVRDGELAIAVQAAQVHATLALAAAVAPDSAAWREVAGAKGDA
jgi:hypothetical protein